MTITINGTTGIAGVDGSASTPAVQGTDTNTGIFFPAADTIAFGEGGAEAMRIDSSGNVGIGVTAGAPATGELLVLANKAIRWMNASSGTEYGDIYTDTSNNMVFRNGSGATERARITSGGYFKASPNGTYLNATGTYHELRTSAADTILEATNTNASTAYGIRSNLSTYFFNTTSFLYDGLEASNLRFRVYSNGGIANYSGNNSNLSDQREKKNIELAPNYLDKICQIPVKTFLYNNQPDTDKTLGVIAQDVQAVSPELVMESNWGTQEEPKMRLSIYQTDLQYALMKCIQELSAKNDALEARLAALEAK